MELSTRLKTIAFASEGMCVADIGTDHGYIPIYLTSEGLSGKAFAMDKTTGASSGRIVNIKRGTGRTDRVHLI